MHYLDVAVLRDECDVYVIDGSREKAQHGEIYRFAKMSAAQFSIKIEIK